MSHIKDIRQRMEEKKRFVAQEFCPFPKNMLVELTNVCNHKCIFCANRKMTRKAGMINAAFMERIIREAYALGTREIGFQTVGEPLIVKDLERYILLAKETGFEYTYIPINGAAADAKRLRSVFEAGLDSIKFSINAGTAASYRLIHGKDDFEKVIDNLRFAAEYRKEFGKPKKIYVTYVVTKQNQHECGGFKKLVGPLVDDLVFISVGNQGGMMNEVDASLRVEGEGPVPRKPPCSILFNRLHVTHEGYLTSCCVDYQNYLVTADLNSCSLKDAWESEAARSLRRRHIKGDLKGTHCYNCLFNKNEKIEPLMPQYATTYDQASFSLAAEIGQRLDL